MNSTPLVVGIGSNTPDREFRVQQAIEALGNRLTNVKVSDVYESDAINGKDAVYCNAVLAATTTLSMGDTIDLLKELEQEAGRTAIDSIEGVVVLDLDLVIWDRRIVRPSDFDRPYFNRGYRQLLASGAFQYHV